MSKRGGNSSEFTQKGCKCKRSACRKNYCECYAHKLRCASVCKCIGCRNHDEDYQREEAETAAFIRNAELMMPLETEGTRGTALIEGALSAMSLTDPNFAGGVNFSRNRSNSRGFYRGRDYGNRGAGYGGRRGGRGRGDIGYPADDGNNAAAGSSVSATSSVAGKTQADDNVRFNLTSTAPETFSINFAYLPENIAFSLPKPKFAKNLPSTASSGGGDGGGDGGVDGGGDGGGKGGDGADPDNTPSSPTEKPEDEEKCHFKVTRTGSLSYSVHIPKRDNESDEDAVSGPEFDYINMPNRKRNSDESSDSDIDDFEVANYHFVEYAVKCMVGIAEDCVISKFEDHEVERRILEELQRSLLIIIDTLNEIDGVPVVVKQEPEDDSYEPNATDNVNQFY